MASQACEGTVCLCCGDKGETKLLVYCRKCQDSAVHHYCMDELSPSDDDIIWVCWDCASRDSDTKSTPQIPSHSEEPVNDPTSSCSLEDVHHMSGDDVGPPSHTSPSPTVPPVYHSTSPTAASSSFSSQCVTGTLPDLPSSAKVFLRPEGLGGTPGFIPSKEGVKHITLVMTGRQDQPYKKWQDVPPQVREMWFREWKRYVTWEPRYELHMKKAFSRKAARQLQGLYSRARKDWQKPIWMEDQVWKAFCQYWRSPEFIEKSEKAKKSRASATGGMLHTGGCISHGTHAERMAQELKRQPTHIEIFTRTHQRKADKSWVDERSRKAFEKFRQEWSQSQVSPTNAGEGASAGTQQSEAEVWEKVVGTNRKGGVYGMPYQQECPKSQSASSDGTPHVAMPSAYVETTLERMRRQMQQFEKVHQRDNILGSQQQLTTHLLMSMMQKMDMLLAQMSHASSSGLPPQPPATRQRHCHRDPAGHHPKRGRF